MATYYFSGNSFTKRQKFHRGFDSLEQAQAFAARHSTDDVFKSRGRWVVEYIKETVFPEEAIRVIIDPKTGKTKYIEERKG